MPAEAGVPSRWWGSCPRAWRGWECACGSEGRTAGPLTRISVEPPRRGAPLCRLKPAFQAGGGDPAAAGRARGGAAAVLSQSRRTPCADWRRAAAALRAAVPAKAGVPSRRYQRGGGALISASRSRRKGCSGFICSERWNVARASSRRPTWA